MVAPPTRVMPPSSPGGNDNPQVDEPPPDNELLQKGRTRAVTRAYRQTATTARPPNLEPFNQPSPALASCDARQLSQPSKYDEAMRSRYYANWSHAMEGGLSGLEEAWTFEDAYQQKGGNVVSAKWVYTCKSDETGKVVKAKSRLVARAFSQHPGVDYEIVVSTTAVPCMRLMAAIPCGLQLDLCHFDVQQAFVQAERKESVLMRMPQGCGALSGGVVRLNRIPYGLKQASRSWHYHLVVRLKSPCFEQSLADACGFRLIEAGSVDVIPVVHVDDIFCCTPKGKM